jgi:hypothetical protein
MFSKDAVLQSGPSPDQVPNFFNAQGPDQTNDLSAGTGLLKDQTNSLGLVSDMVPAVPDRTMATLG